MIYEENNLRGQSRSSSHGLKVIITYKKFFFLYLLITSIYFEELFCL